VRFDETVNGYRVVTEPTNSGGGMCVWAFAVKGDREYFIKEFLQPKWPTPESMGSEAGKERRRADCYEFERRHSEVMRRLANATTTPGGGNLVTAVDFFRSGTAYYKITEKIVTASLASLRDLPVRERAVIFRTLILSLQILHRKDIVHSDLKPANVLIQQVPRSTLHTAKLIDFDDSFLSGSPPPRDQIVGDSMYGAPEWFGYATHDAAVTAAMLTRAADVFALALLLHHYLTDALPGYDSDRYSAPGQAVSAGERLNVDERLHGAFATLLHRMLALRPPDRPVIDQVFSELRDDALLEIGAPGRPRRRVQVNMPGSRLSPATADSRHGDSDGPRSGTVTGGKSSRVRINLSSKPKEK
jgi:eukaryotic-like serine/threonine-protein kinase